jgi:hypothetical protein
MHPDNGSEFLNWHLVQWCRETEVAPSRPRPEHKNDNCHAEQKHWTLVRRLMGYQRLDTPAQLAWLDALYDLIRPYTNCFQRAMKLIEKHGWEPGCTSPMTVQPPLCAASLTVARPTPTRSRSWSPSTPPARSNSSCGRSLKVQ